MTPEWQSKVGQNNPADCRSTQSLHETITGATKIAGYKTRR
jgi:hypothetical protein